MPAVCHVPLPDLAISNASEAVMNIKDSSKTQILKRLPIFCGLTDSDLDIIAPVMKPVSFNAGEDVIREGDTDHSMYIISSGSVEVLKTGGTGDEVSLGILPAGTFFGELSLFDDHPRSATVRAAEDTDSFNITRRDMLHCLGNHAELANILYRNTIMEIFSRFRAVTSNFTFSQHHLRTKERIINEIDRDLRAASEVQNFFVMAEDDEAVNSRAGISRHYIYLPSKAIGGDFISIMNDPAENICIMIADVEGHGISASLATGALKSAFAFLVPQYGSDAELFLFHLNNHLCRVLKTLYATCYYAYIDTSKKKITFAKAGHHHPFFFKADTGSFAELDLNGSVIGLMPDALYGSSTFDINAGDKILFYTDGIVEQRNMKSEMYSPERLGDMFRKNIDVSGDHIISTLIADLCGFTGEESFDDDITMLLYEFR